LEWFTEHSLGAARVLGCATGLRFGFDLSDALRLGLIARQILGGEAVEAAVDFYGFHRTSPTGGRLVMNGGRISIADVLSIGP
jgi:hypothetical protein